MIDRYIELFNPPRYKKAQLAWRKDKLGRHALCDITPAMVAAGRDELLQGITKKENSKEPFYRRTLYRSSKPCFYYRN